MMKSLALLAALVLSIREAAVSGFSAPPSTSAATSRTKLHSAAPKKDDIQTQPRNGGRHVMQRRSVLSNFLASSSLLLLPAVTLAGSIPSVTSAEFDIILEDSAKSILSVELSGPKSETALVKLFDGTAFTISDLVESSTDPRSPLKLVARCRLYNIPVKNTGLISAVSGEGSLIRSSGKKKKNYMNPRVQEAQKKEAEKRERMAEDERERLEELYKMEGNEKGFLSE